MNDLDEKLILKLYEQIDGLNARINHLERLEHAMAQGYGWISAAWQKNPLAFGYSGQVLRAWSNTSLAMGTNNVDDSAVPAGEIWIITSYGFVYEGTVPTQVVVSIFDSSTRYDLFRQVAPTSLVMYDRQGWWIMKAGDVLRLLVTGATAGDDLYGFAVGFRVDIDQ